MEPGLKKKADLMCLINIVLIVGSILLAITPFILEDTILKEFTTENYRAWSEITNFTVLTAIGVYAVAFVLAIYDKIKFKKHVASQVIFWVMLVITILLILAFIALAIMVAIMIQSCVSGCNGCMDVMQNCY